MLAAVGTLFLVGSADAGYTVSVTPSEQNGVPEETLSFTITIENTDPDDDDVFNINVSFVGSVEQDCDGCWDTWVSQASLSIDADETGSTNFYVKIGIIVASSQPAAGCMMWYTAAWLHNTIHKLLIISIFKILPMYN